MYIQADSCVCIEQSASTPTNHAQNSNLSQNLYSHICHNVKYRMFCVRVPSGDNNPFDNSECSHTHIYTETERHIYIYIVSIACDLYFICLWGSWVENNIFSSPKISYFIIVYINLCDVLCQGFGARACINVGVCVCAGEYVYLCN